MKTVLVTGGNGQLATCIKDISDSLNDTKFIYTDLPEFDIVNKEIVFSLFAENNIDYCINCAGYTAVDRAESDMETAHNVNVIGVQNLAESCKDNNVVLIHISTDFVFDGEQTVAYDETDETNPLSVYGRTKLVGEEVLQVIFNNYFIIRTSWLYSEYGNNFMKTMMRLGKERDELSIVSDQIGTPTYAKDLAKTILKFIETNNMDYGTYHYSNKGKTTWYGFAKTIFEEANISINLKPTKTSAYPTPAKRPLYSVLDKSKIQEVLNIEIPYWKESLKIALRKLHT